MPLNPHIPDCAAEALRAEVVALKLSLLVRRAFHRVFLLLEVQLIVVPGALSEGRGAVGEQHVEGYSGDAAQESVHKREGWLLSSS